MTTPHPPTADADDHAPLLRYPLRWRPAAGRPGAHPGAGRGGQDLFRGLVPLMADADPRRIDIRASLKDPFEGIHVRAFAPRRALTVTAMVDLSASMSFGTLLDEAARLVAALAASSVASGDAFGLIAADTAFRADLFIPPTRRRGVPDEVRTLLAEAGAHGAGTGGLLEATARLPRSRSLVVLVSDFLMPDDGIVALLDALARHDVLPVVLHDSRAEGDLPRFGLMELHDAETGRRRLVVLRPALRARWQAAARARRQALDQIFLSRGLSAFHLTDRFDAHALLDFLLHR